MSTLEIIGALALATIFVFACLVLAGLIEISHEIQSPRDDE